MGSWRTQPLASPTAGVGADRGTDARMGHLALLAATLVAGLAAVAWGRRHAQFGRDGAVRHTRCRSPLIDARGMVRIAQVAGSAGAARVPAGLAHGNLAAGAG
jgi:hypothetical protein